MGRTIEFLLEKDKLSVFKIKLKVLLLELKRFQLKKTKQKRNGTGYFSIAAMEAFLVRDL